MHSANSLQFFGRIENRFDKEDVCRFDQIQSFGARRKGQQEAGDIQIGTLKTHV